MVIKASFLPLCLAPAIVIAAVLSLGDVIAPIAQEHAAPIANKLDSSGGNISVAERDLFFTLEGNLVCRQGKHGTASEAGFFDDETGSFTSLRARFKSLKLTLKSSKASPHTDRFAVTQARDEIYSANWECRRFAAKNIKDASKIAESPNYKRFEIFSDSITLPTPPNIVSNLI